MSKSRRFAVAIILSVMATLAAPVPAQAHTSSTFYNTYWPGYASISYGMHIGFPTGAYRTIHLNGKNQWNNASSGREPNFYWSLPDDVNYGSPATPCNLRQNTGALFWRDLNYLGLGVAGATRRCSGDGIIATFTIEFDSTRSWYVGTGDAGGSQTDWWSVVSHEFGHATGWSGHFGSGESICADNSSQETMCPVIIAGTERMRTLNTHDLHTFLGAY